MTSRPARSTSTVLTDAATPKPFNASILDTGASLNFFATGQADLLINVLGSLSVQLQMPEDVIQEILDKESEDARFRRVDRPLNWALRSGHIERLDSRSGIDPDLDRNVARLTGVPWEQRQARAKDQGERMVIAHARTRAGRGEQIIAFIDDKPAQALAHRNGVNYTDTPSILRQGARLGFIENWGIMRAMYLRMRPEDGSRQPTIDHGLPRLDNPDLQRKLRDPAIYEEGAARRAARPGPHTETTG